MMTTIAKSYTAAGRIRRATKPRHKDHELPDGVYLAMWLVLVAVAIGVCVWPRLHIGVLVSAVLTFIAAPKAGKLIPRYWNNDNSSYMFVVPVAGIVASLLVDSVGWLAWFIAPLGLVVALLWDWAPWFALMAKRANAKAGFVPFLPIPFPHDYVTERDCYGLTRVDDPAFYEQYQPMLREQLGTLSGEWEVTYGRLRADALAVGPAGVAALYSVTLDGREVTFVESSHPRADELRTSGSVAMREIGGVLVPGSAASKAVQMPENRRFDRDVIINHVHVGALTEAAELESEFVDLDGNDVGYSLPAAPVMEAGYLANVVHMGVEHQVIPVFLAHSLVMDQRWGYVQVFSEEGYWNGWGVLCHPRYVAECLEALPGVFPSAEAVSAAQDAVDLHTRV